MTIKKWSAGDTITARSANNKGIRKGTTADRDAIVAADLEPGDLFYNEDVEQMQMLISEGPNVWKSLPKALIFADETEVTVVGTTATKVKEGGFIKSNTTIEGTKLSVAVRIKTDNGGTTGTVRVRTDGGGGDDLTLTTTSVTFELKTGTIDITAKSNEARHTIEFYMDDGVGDTITMDTTEVYLE